MGLLDGLLGGAGLLGALGNSAKGRNYTNKGFGYLDQAANTAGQNYRQLVDFYNQSKALGKYDPAAEIALTNKQAGDTFKTGTGNIATSLARLGYKPGDSNIEQNQKNFSAENQIALQKQLLGINNAYQQKQQSDLYGLSQAGNQYANALGGFSDKYINYGNQISNQGGGLGGVLGSLGSLGLFGGSGGGNSSTDWRKYGGGTGQEQYGGYN